MIRIVTCLASFALACATGFACAQTYPSKPVRVIVQYPPGGVPDIYGRVMASELAKVWNQSVVVENRTGASGTIGTDYVAKAAPDGYTLLFAGDGPITVIPNLVAKMPYNSVRDLVPIVNVAQQAFVLLVHPSVPANNMKDLIDWIRAQKGKASFASSGNGSQQHLAMEWIRTMAGSLDMTHVPYKGFGQALVDVFAGQVLMLFSGPTAAIQITRTGKLKALGVTGKTRIPAMPGVPAIADDFPGYEIIAWNGFLAPAGTPRDIVNKIHTDVVAIIKRPDFQERLAKDGIEPIANTPEEFSAQIKGDLVRWARIVKASGVALD